MLAGDPSFGFNVRPFDLFRSQQRHEGGSRLFTIGRHLPKHVNAS